MTRKIKQASVPDIEKTKNNLSPEYDSAFRERLVFCTEFLGGNKKVGNLVGVSDEQVRNWSKGLAKTPFYAMKIITLNSNKSLDWLAYGEDPKQAGDETGASIITVPLYNASLAAGAGSFNENAQAIHNIPFRKEFLHRIVGRGSVKDLAILTVQGDSMEPTIHNSDIVLIDEQSKNIGDGIFCFVQDGLARVKRLHKMASGQVEIISDNKTYRIETISSSEIEPFHIIGRVCWIGHQT